MPSVYVKDYDTTVNFPDNTPPEVIQQALQKKFPPIKATPVPKEESFLSKAGGFVGDIAEGMALGTGDFLKIANPALGAAVGAGAYTAVKGAERGIRQFTGNLPPSTAGEELSKQAEDLKEGATMMATGGVIGKAATVGINKILAPAAKQVKEGAVKLIDKFKYPATPADITQTKTLGILEGILGYKPISGDVMLKKNTEKLTRMMQIREELINKGADNQTIEQFGKNIKKEAKSILSKYTNAKEDVLTGMADDFLNKYGSLSKAEGGEQFVSAMSKDLKTRNENISSLYTQVKELLPQKGKDLVPLSGNINTMAKELLDEELSKASAQQNPKIIKTLQDFLPKGNNLGLSDEVLSRNPTIKNELQQANSMTWNGIDKTRGQLLENRREILQATGGKETNESRIYSKLASALDDEMSSFAETLGSKPKEVLSQAREASRMMHELYDKDILNVMNKSTEDIVDRIVNKGEVTLIKQVKDTLGEGGLEPIRKSFFKKIISGATGQNGIVDGKKLNKTLASYGEDTLKQIMSPKQATMLKNIADKGIFINEKMAGMKTIDFLETLSGSSNENIVNTIFKPNNTELVKTTKRLLSGDKITELKSQVIEKILKVGGNGNYLPVSSAKEFAKYNAPLKELLSPAEYENIRDFIKLGENASRIERLAINASQTGQVMMGNETLNKILTAPKQIGYTLGIPYIMSKVYTSKLAMKYLSQATQLPVASEQAISLFSKAMMVSENNKLSKSREVYMSDILEYAKADKYLPEDATLDDLLQAIKQGNVTSMIDEPILPDPFGLRKDKP